MKKLTITESEESLSHAMISDRELNNVKKFNKPKLLILTLILLLISITLIFISSLRIISAVIGIIAIFFLPYGWYIRNQYEKLVSKHKSEETIKKELFNVRARLGGFYLFYFIFILGVSIIAITISTYGFTISFWLLLGLSYVAIAILALIFRQKIAHLEKELAKNPSLYRIVVLVSILLLLFSLILRFII